MQMIPIITSANSSWGRYVIGPVCVWVSGPYAGLLRI